MKLNEYQVYSKGPKQGQPKTLTDRVIRYMIEGLKKQEHSSKNKYRKFYRDENTFYWVGKAGAVRAGKNISNSISVTVHFHSLTRIWEKQTGKI